MRRIFRIASGFLLILVGLLLSLPGVPGPGFVLVFLGLVLLSQHFDWARRARDWARQKAAQVKEKALGPKR
ncbi:MAG: PGPGW domain-containing protein [Acidobacteriota bacterium]